MIVHGQQHMGICRWDRYLIQFFNSWQGSASLQMGRIDVNHKLAMVSATLKLHNVNQTSFWATTAPRQCPVSKDAFSSYHPTIYRWRVTGQIAALYRASLQQLRFSGVQWPTCLLMVCFRCPPSLILCKWCLASLFMTTFRCVFQLYLKIPL